MSGPAEVVRRMTEAFNTRDRDGFLGVLGEDVEFRNPLGKTMRGSEAASTFRDANVQQGVLVEQDDAERVDGQEVAVPTIMLHGGRHRTAVGRGLRSAGRQDRAVARRDGSRCRRVVKCVSSPLGANSSAAHSPQ